MKGASAGCMLDLLPARDPWRYHNSIGVVFHSRKESAAANRDRDVVMFFFVSERTRHATAAGIDFGSRYLKEALALAYTVEEIDSGCCGMAGCFWLYKKKFYKPSAGSPRRLLSSCGK